MRGLVFNSIVLNIMCPQNLKDFALVKKIKSKHKAFVKWVDGNKKASLPPHCS